MTGYEWSQEGYSFCEKQGIRQYLKLMQVLCVSGPMNPADAATRGISVAKLKKTKEWFNGPEFLTHQDDSWPEQTSKPRLRPGKYTA
jgi:hypothetical protein